MPSLSTDRVRKSRALHAASGAKRVEAVLTPSASKALSDLMERYGLGQGQAVIAALEDGSIWGIPHLDHPELG